MNMNSGAVFFLGSRSHYQVLQPSYNLTRDIENGNIEEQYRSDGEDINDNPKDEFYNYLLENPGVMRRRRNTSVETEHDNWEDKGCHLSISGSDKNHVETGGGFGTLRAIFNTLKGASRRKRRYSNEYVADDDNICTYKDSCRCVECQSRYFECDNMSECSETSDCSDSSGWNSDYERQPHYDQKRHNIIEIKPGNTAPNASLKKFDDDDENGDMELQMAAGTPVVLDYLLNHPIMCSIQ